MITANQARNLTGRMRKSNALPMKVQRIMLNAMREGQGQATLVSNNLSDDDKNYLRRLGYNVVAGPTFTVVIWEELPPVEVKPIPRKKLVRPPYDDKAQEHESRCYACAGIDE